MKRTKLRVLQLMTIAVVVVLTSCNIWEDNSNCAMHIQFKYDYNMLQQNLFPTQCDKVELFVFNADGKLIQRIVEEGEALKNQDYAMPLHLDAGNYTLMAWAGHKSSYALTNANNGSSLHEMILDLNHKDYNWQQPLEPLWNGTPIPLSIENTYGEKRTINLIKNTNRLNLKLYSKDNDFNANDVEIRIKSANGSYHYDNSPADKKSITYRPFKEENLNGKEAAYSIDCLRLVDGEDVKLSVINKKTGESMLPTREIDLIDFLLKTKPQGMGRQEYLDREDTWNFSLYTKQAFIAIMIQINGWIVWSQDDEL